VPYRDGNQLHSAVAAGELNLMISSWATARVVMDRLQPLAVSAPARQPGYPQVPTMQEAIGLSDFEVNSWAVLMGRKGAPQAILDQMQADTIKVIQSPDVQRRSGQIGIDVQGKKAAELVQMIQSEVSRYRAVIQKTGIQKD
jgi:tripartite-type tricarboxylate transporter receptor subunit TctC